VVISLILVVIDWQTSSIKHLYQSFNNAALPFHWISDVPGKIGNFTSNLFTGGSELVAENEELAAELLVYQGKVQRMANLTAENMRLRNLLNATELLQDRVLVAELIGVNSDPLSHVITINRGAVDGVFSGQPVIDSDGLMGQIDEVYDNHSRVLLITDSRHALPVEVARNGLRAIAEGIGDYRQLRLRHISHTQDLKAGDTLVSSGLGGRYPKGYPVGMITEVVKNPGENFVAVTVEPAAQVDRSRHLLLVFSEVLDLASSPATDDDSQN